MPDDARQTKGPTGGTVIVWIFLLAVAALLVMVIYTFAATDDGPPPRNKISYRTSAAPARVNPSFIR